MQVCRGMFMYAHLRSYIASVSLRRACCCVLVQLLCNYIVSVCCICSRAASCPGDPANGERGERRPRRSRRWRARRRRVRRVTPCGVDEPASGEPARGGPARAE